MSLNKTMCSKLQLFKYVLGGSFIGGLSIGSMLPNISVKYTNKKYEVYYRHNFIKTPLIVGLISTSSLICFPALFMLYMTNNAFFDKIYDKYIVEFSRFHQYNNLDKYGYRSIIKITIIKKSDKIIDNIIED